VHCADFVGQCGANASIVGAGGVSDRLKGSRNLRPSEIVLRHLGYKLDISIYCVASPTASSLIVPANVRRSIQASAGGSLEE
jgi:hypothetical protein